MLANSLKSMLPNGAIRFESEHEEDRMDLAKVLAAAVKSFEAYKEASKDKVLDGNEILSIVSGFMLDSGIGAAIHANVK